MRLVCQRCADATGPFAHRTATIGRRAHDGSGGELVGGVRQREAGDRVDEGVHGLPVCDDVDGQSGPARILRVPGGTLSPGSPADITVLAPDLKVRVRASQLRSRSKNTPFDGWELRGGVAATIVGGRTVYVNSESVMGSGVI